MSFVHFGLVIPPFVKEAMQIRIALNPGICEIEQHIEHGQRPRRYRVAMLDLSVCFLYPASVHTPPSTGFTEGYAQESRLLMIALDEMDPSSTCFRQ